MTVAPRRKLYNCLGICMSVCTAAVLSHEAAIYGGPLVHQVLLGIEGALDLGSPYTYIMVGAGRRQKITKKAENNLRWL